MLYLAIKYCVSNGVRISLDSKLEILSICAFTILVACSLVKSFRSSSSSKVLISFVPKAVR